MRLSILALSVALFFIPRGRTQDSVAVANVSTSVAQPSDIPPMARPKPSRQILDAPRRYAPITGVGAKWNFRPIPKRRVADTQFWIVAGSTIGTSLLLVEATSHCRHTANRNSCLGQAGGFKPIQGIQITLSGILTTVGYGMKKFDRDTHTHHSKWWMFPVAITVFNTFEVVDQYRKHCSAGTVYDGRSCK